MSEEIQGLYNVEAQEAGSPVIIYPAMPGLKLQQMLTTEDDKQYFEFQNRNIEHIEEFGNTIDKSEEEVTRRRLGYGDDRFGIWLEDQLVGMVGYSTPYHAREAAIGILLDKDFTSRGIATASVKALTEYTKSRFDRVFAEVRPDNEDSIKLMDRAGYRTNGQVIETEWGKALVFEAPK